MGRFSGIVILLVYSSFLLAQKGTPKPDKIVRLDNTVIEGFVKEINSSYIHYNRLLDPNGQSLPVPVAEVWKIIWNNGEEEIINPKEQKAKVEASPLSVTDLLVKKESVLPQKFWMRKGAYWGARGGAGLTIPVKPVGSDLASEHAVAYQGGLAVGYRFRQSALQLDVLYTCQQFALTVPEEGFPEAMEPLKGIQNRLIVPLTFTRWFRINGITVGPLLGVYAGYSIGAGGTRVRNAGKPAVTYKNCSDCKDTAFGAVAGVSGTLVERSRFALVMDVKWYHGFGDNTGYRRAESSVAAHNALIGISLLHKFSN